MSDKFKPDEFRKRKHDSPTCYHYGVYGDCAMWKLGSSCDIHGQCHWSDHPFPGDYCKFFKGDIDEENE